MSVNIIAEIGWNWMGDMNLARHMVEKAAEAGATYAKFQTWSVKRLKPGPWDTDGRRQIYERAELSVHDHAFLMNVCNDNNIEFMSSVFSIPDAELLVDLGVTNVKIPSFESRNLELIQFCVDNFDYVVMSSGTSTYEEILRSVNILRKAKNWHLMHCVSSYPCDYSMANLPLMRKFIQRYGADNIGYSDHIQGVESAKIAIGDGATLIEKHFTIDNDLEGRDNKFAILPNQLKELSDYIQYIDKMNINQGSDYQVAEQEAREIYTGRFNG